MTNDEAAVYFDEDIRIECQAWRLKYNRSTLALTKKLAPEYILPIVHLRVFLKKVNQGAESFIYFSFTRVPVIDIQTYTYYLKISISLFKTPSFY